LATHITFLNLTLDWHINIWTISSVNWCDRAIMISASNYK